MMDSGQSIRNIESMDSFTGLAPGGSRRAMAATLEWRAGQGSSGNKKVTLMPSIPCSSYHPVSQNHEFQSENLSFSNSKICVVQKHTLEKLGDHLK